jgi:hypothetical protein
VSDGSLVFGTGSGSIGYDEIFASLVSETSERLFEGRQELSKGFGSAIPRTSIEMFSLLAFAFVGRALAVAALELGDTHELIAALATAVFVPSLVPTSKSSNPVVPSLDLTGSESSNSESGHTESLTTVVDPLDTESQAESGAYEEPAPTFSGWPVGTHSSVHTTVPVPQKTATRVATPLPAQSGMETPRATERPAATIHVSGDQAIDSTNETVRIIGTGTIRPAEEATELILTDVIVPAGSNITSEGLVVQKTLELTGTAILTALDVIRFGEGATLVLQEDSLQLPRCELGDVSLITSIPTINVGVQGLGNALQQSGELEGFRHVLLIGAGWPIEHCREKWVPNVNIAGADGDVFEAVCQTSPGSGRMLMGRVALEGDKTELLIQNKTPEEKQEDGANAGAIAGGVIGGLVAAAAIVAAVYFIHKKRQLQAAYESSVSSSSSKAPDSLTQESDPGEGI